MLRVGGLGGFIMRRRGLIPTLIAPLSHSAQVSPPLRGGLNRSGSYRNRKFCSVSIGFPPFVKQAFEYQLHEASLKLRCVA